MPNDRIDATQFSLLQTLKRALLWCIYALHHYLIIKPQQLLAPRMILRSSDETADPINKSQSKPAMPLQYLKYITNNFSDERILGEGAFGIVYKGLLQNGEMVAVKKLSQANQSSQVQFENEVNLLMKLKHQNVVQLLGYCYETKHIRGKRDDGKSVFALDTERMLCLECLPNGSLDKYISDASSGLDWHTRHKVIEGICYGLQYLHKHSHDPIIHLDLKPSNILLDENMLPKITDFGLSRLFDQNQTIHTKIASGTFGYMPPEFMKGIITPMWDIFSLGVVIMEVITGHRDYPDDIRISSKGFIELELKKWRNKLQKEPGYTSLEIDCQQIEICIQIGLICVNRERTKRPSMKKIISMLDGSESMDWHIINEAEDDSNDLHNTPNTSRDTTSEENVTLPDAGGRLLGTLNEAMDSLNGDIRRCLEYCSIFPRGSKLLRGNLVRLWIAQGFVKTTCATDDMEDIANGYIQDLVACSFLEPIFSGSDCFTIHDVVHGILDKVAENCFRVENASSHEGEVWEGDVPRHIQHLLIRNYDGELITETIIGLEYLRTLIVYVVGKDTPVEEKVIESICKRLPKLRVLAIAFSHEHDLIEQPNEFSVSESVGQLKYLRYLAFRTRSRCKITLPSTLNKLQHIQVLDFGSGNISGFTFAELVNLRHIFCSLFSELRFVSRLSSLQTLPGFTVSNEQGCELKQLMDLNKLCGSLRIRGLGKVEGKGQALEANLAAKRLTNLTLSWEYHGLSRCSPEVQKDVVEGMCPHMGLKVLTLEDYEGSRYPDWMMGNHNGGPKYLQELEICACRVAVPYSGLAEAFPHLRRLILGNCSWDTLPDNMVHLTSLKDLRIACCENIRSLPSLPQSLETFTLYDCNDQFMESCKTVGHPNWKKIQHVPKKSFYV